jgi:hypothetical protein
MTCHFGMCRDYPPCGGCCHCLGMCLVDHDGAGISESDVTSQYVAEAVDGPVTRSFEDQGPRVPTPPQ